LKKYATLYKGDTIVLLTELLVIMKLGYISILLQARLMMQAQDIYLCSKKFSLPDNIDTTRGTKGRG
jgi:hypothetical protein